MNASAGCFDFAQHDIICITCRQYIVTCLIPLISRILRQLSWSRRRPLPALAKNAALWRFLYASRPTAGEGLNAVYFYFIIKNLLHFD